MERGKAAKQAEAKAKATEAQAKAKAKHANGSELAEVIEQPRSIYIPSRLLLSILFCFQQHLFWI